MPHLLPFSFKQSLALICTCHSVAIPTTLIGLGHRIHSRRLWWDDFWAATALGSDIILFVVYLATISGSGPEKGLKRSATFVQASRWLTLLSYTMTLWAARLTVAVTIVRILPQGRMRRIAKAASIFFGLLAMAMIFQKVIACTRKRAQVTYCTTVSKYSLYTGIMELVTDCVADVWLLFAPAYILWQMKLQRDRRNLILAIFLCGVFTSLASIAHVVFILVNSPLWLRLTGHIEVAVAIIVSNLLVVVTYIYRVFRQFNASREAGASNSPDASGDTETTMTTTGQLSGEESAFLSTASSSKMATQTTTVELTELSHLGTSLDISTANSQSYNPTNGTIGSTPCSSFSYPTSHIHTSSLL